LRRNNNFMNDVMLKKMMSFFTSEGRNGPVDQ
jgi:hypothetical protein